MNPLQHVFRRGHTFWWRRVHHLFDNATVDVRMSLRTGDRVRARNMGAALTAEFERVLSILNDQVRVSADITERELQAIAKAMYEERLLEVCVQQRETPGDAEYHSAANRAFADYFQRLTDLGGHASLLPAEEGKLRDAGWAERRIADLRAIIQMRELRGITAIRRDEIDHHIAKAGYTADDRLRWLVETASYPFYRDAYQDAERHLSSLDPLGATGTVPGTQASKTTVASPVVGDTSDFAIDEQWLSLTPIEAAERMIMETPRLLEHRRDGKRGQESVGEQTLRQIRWAATLLQKSLPSGTPFWKVRKDDIITLDKHFDSLSIHYGKSPRDRILSGSLDEAAAAAIEKVEAGYMSAGDIGLSRGTANKHYNKLGQIHVFMRKHVEVAEKIDFGEFTTAVNADEREARMRYTREQGEAVLFYRLGPEVRACGNACRRVHSLSTMVSTMFFYLFGIRELVEKSCVS